MNLTEAIADYKTEFRTRVPDETKATMAQATQDLIDSGLAAQSLQVGDHAPDFSLPNAVGKSISLSEMLKTGPVVLSFYRGGWCPYCNLELRALQEKLPEIQALGASLIAISPQTPDASLSTQEKQELTFEVLSDRGNQVAKQYGLVFTLPPELRSIYENFGIDLPGSNGDESFELPMPATYVVDATGIVVYAFAAADYTTRAEPAEVIAALHKL